MYRLVKTISFCAHVRVAAVDLKNRRCSARKFVAVKFLPSDIPAGNVNLSLIINHY
jgi:hypothetical protein